MKEQTKNIIISVGREADNSFTVFENGISPYHLELWVEDSILWLSDKTSGEKTEIQIDKKWVKTLRVPLMETDTIRLSGQVELKASEFWKHTADLPSYTLSRHCSICKKTPQEKDILSCITCEGKFLGAVSDVSEFYERTLSLNPVIDEKEKKSKYTYQKKTRCLTCAEVFNESLKHCPSCHGA